MVGPPVKINKLKAITAPGDTIVTPKGNVVTKEQWQTAAKNGLPFATHQDYADYVDRWAKPPGQTSATPANSGSGSQQAPATNKPVTPQIELSDKAKGTSSTYYPSRDQAKSPSPPEIKSSRY